MVSRYVYRTVRVAGRVQRTYLGTLADPVVQTLERFKQLGQATTEAEEAKVVEDLTVVERGDACLAIIQATASRIVRNLRRRYQRAHYCKIPRCTMPDVPINRDDYDQLVADAADGSSDALTELRRVLKSNPALYRALGDLNGHVQRHLLNVVAAGAVDTQDAMQMMLAEKREELLAEGDSLPEQLLVDQVLTTMLDAAYCQIGLTQPDHKAPVRRRWERQLQRAQARHYAAISSLVEVRQMLEGWAIEQEMTT